MNHGRVAANQRTHRPKHLFRLSHRASTTCSGPRRTRRPPLRRRSTTSHPIPTSNRCRVRSPRSGNPPPRRCHQQRTRTDRSPRRQETGIIDAVPWLTSRGGNRGARSPWTSCRDGWRRCCCRRRGGDRQSSRTPGRRRGVGGTSRGPHRARRTLPSRPPQPGIRGRLSRLRSAASGPGCVYDPATGLGCAPFVDRRRRAVGPRSDHGSRPRSPRQ